MYQLTKDFYPSASLLPQNISTTDKIYDDEIMHPFAEVTGDVHDYYSLTDMSYASDDYYKSTATTIELAPLSPTLTGEELNNWKLNEVFHDIIDMESTTQLDTKEKEMPVFGSEEFFRSGDLLAEAFSLDGFDVNSSAAALANETVQVKEDPELSQLVPLPVFDIPSCPASPEPTTALPAAPSKVTINLAANKAGKGKSRGKKSKRSSLDILTVKPHETKKEAIRRVKNNEASRDFRSRKKYKLEDLLVQEEHLTGENRQIKSDVAMIEEVVRVLKEGLINSAKGFHN